MLFVCFEFNDDVTASDCITSKDLITENHKVAGMWTETATA
jgi:hypothetical protein